MLSCKFASQILSPQRNNADKAKKLIAIINEAVVLIRRNKDNAVFGYLGFSLLPYHHPLV